MSCGISLMYKISGGVDKKMRKCEECRYLIESEEGSGFGRKENSRISYRCSKHPDKSEIHIWSPGYPACRKIRKKKDEEPPAYVLGDGGQYVLVLT